MSSLLSVGLDVGTTSTQLVASRLTVENRASSFAVPDMDITERAVLYKSPVYFTPLLDESHVDGAAIREIVQAEYQKAGIRREDVDTGAIIITGETSRKENARAVLDALSDYAGDFVVATAGPDLESVLAAKGAGAVELSRTAGKPVLHMDIGGGTSNLALIEDGKILRTGCLNVGGRLIKFQGNGEITYVSPVLSGIFPGKPGEIATQSELRELAESLTQALEMAAGLREPTDLIEKFLTAETGEKWTPPAGEVIVSFSGGVADCVGSELPWNQFGDLGPILGQTIRKSYLCRGQYALGRETIRATVIGAGSYSTQLSGSTVYSQNVRFPLKNLPVVEKNSGIHEGSVVLSLPGIPSPTYAQVREIARELARTHPPELYICLEADMAKALGQALAVQLPPETRILCIDRIRVGEDSYLDIGQPVGGAFPVVVKTLVLERSKHE
ncbi:MAG: ethanolamine ammonia-lyase reactivating factor EutA [Clostridiales bacterium]|nr:ethanolamine ammonia-lyase reactivating factor EutA [Clostridiales bacterium]